MHLKIKTLCLTLAIGALCAGSARADLLAYFNFNNVNLSSGSIGIFLDSGSEEKYDASKHTISPASAGVKAESAVMDFSAFDGELGGLINGGTTNWGVYFGTPINAVDGFDPGGALALGSGLNGKPVVLVLNTEGYRELKVSFATRSSAENGATEIVWEISSDGVSFEPAGAVTLTQDNNYAMGEIDLSASRMLDNARKAYIRFSFEGTTQNGNVRIDNIQIIGSKAR